MCAIGQIKVSVDLDLQSEQTVGEGSEGLRICERVLDFPVYANRVNSIGLLFLSTSLLEREKEKERERDLYAYIFMNIYINISI